MQNNNEINQVLLGKILIKGNNGETYDIVQIENVFGVTSSEGLDTIGNGKSFNSIESALSYVKDRIKNY